MICQDRHDGRCAGTVDFRLSLSGTGSPTIRCTGHWDRRLEQHRQHLRDYPDGPTPPRWYTAQGGAAYAGESWDEPD